VRPTPARSARNVSIVTRRTFGRRGATECPHAMANGWRLMAMANGRTIFHMPSAVCH